MAKHNDLNYDDGDVRELIRTMHPKPACHKTISKQMYRRAYSEVELLDMMGHDFRDGESYHVISGGDIDSLSFLKVILRQQDLEYCLLSTWCMALADVDEIASWTREGKIKSMDCYVGEIFPGSYYAEYAKLKEVIHAIGGRVAVFRNHSKVYAGYGKKFAFAIESSANVNTNPRAENTCITIGKEIYAFYREYYDGIVSFMKEEIEKIRATPIPKKEVAKQWKW